MFIAASDSTLLAFNITCLFILSSKMRACLFAIAAISSMGASTAFYSSRNSARAPPSFLLSIRGGANEYEAKFEGVKASVTEKAATKVSF